MSNNDTSDNHITALRQHLFSAIRGLRNGELEVDKARAINELGKTLVDTARVEVDYLKATDGAESPFIAAQATTAPPDGITGITRHLLKG